MTDSCYESLKCHKNILDREIDFLFYSILMCHFVPIMKVTEGDQYHIFFHCLTFSLYVINLQKKHTVNKEGFREDVPWLSM